MKENYSASLVIEQSGSVGLDLSSWRNLVMVCTNTSLSSCWVEDAGGGAVPELLPVKLYA